MKSSASQRMSIVAKSSKPNFCDQNVSYFSLKQAGRTASTP